MAKETVATLTARVETLEGQLADVLSALEGARAAYQAVRELLASRPAAPAVVQRRAAVCGPCKYNDKGCSTPEEVAAHIKEFNAPGDAARAARIAERMAAKAERDAAKQASATLTDEGAQGPRDEDRPPPAEEEAA